MDLRGAHVLDDVDSKFSAWHHTIGLGPNQASSGSHTHDGINSKFIPGASVSYVVSTDEPTTSNDASTNTDTQLTFSTEANCIYEVEIFVYFRTTVNCDIRTNWVVPSGATGLKGCVGSTSASAAYVSRDQTQVRIGGHGLNTQIGYQLETGDVAQIVWERGIVRVTTAGTIAFSWSQFTAVVGNLVRIADSFMKITRIS